MKAWTVNKELRVYEYYAIAYMTLMRDQENIAATIREVRAKLKYSQEELANRLNVSFATVNRGTSIVRPRRGTLRRTGCGKPLERPSPRGGRAASRDAPLHTRVQLPVGAPGPVAPTTQHLRDLYSEGDISYSLV